MIYRGFFISYKAAENVVREDKNGKQVMCLGAEYKVFSDIDKQRLLDEFIAAAGFELPDSGAEISAESIEEFAREMVDSRYKDYCRMVESEMCDDKIL